MIRKTALLYSMTAALMIAAPAVAQEQTQDANTAAPSEAAAQPQSLSLSPGATVKSADGSEFGKLVGVQNGASGQELTVRGADGSVRAVSVQGIRQDGSDIVVAASLNDYMSATPIAEAAMPAAPVTPAAQDAAMDAPAEDNADMPTEEPTEAPVEEPKA